MNNIKIDFNMLAHIYNNGSLNNNWCDDFHFPESYRQDMTYLCDEGIGFDHFRIWIKVEEIYDKVTGQYDYERYYRYLQVASMHSRKLLLNIDTNVNNDCEVYVEVLANILQHYKQRFHNIVYIECLNEPDLIGIDVVLYYKWYRTFYHALFRVNQGKCGQDRLLLGGPVLSGFNRRYMDAFICLYASDSSSDKVLDFLSIHEYGGVHYGGEHENEVPIRYEHMSNVYGERNAVEKILQKYRMDTQIPLFITETGVFPGDRATDCYEEDMLAQCAGSAVITAMYGASSDKNVLFHWAVRHKTNPRKNLIPEGRLKELTAYGKMLKLLAGMNGRVADITPGYQEYVNGPGAFAVANTKTLQILLWNYRYVDYKTGEEKVTLQITGIPFDSRNIRIMVKSIDGKEEVQIVKNEKILRKEVILGRNSVCLMEISEDTNDDISRPKATPGFSVPSSLCDSLYAENAFRFAEIKVPKIIYFLNKADFFAEIERSFDGHFWETIYRGQAHCGEVSLDKSVLALYLREKNGEYIIKVDSASSEYLLGCADNQNPYRIKGDKLLEPAMLDGDNAYLILSTGNRMTPLCLWLRFGDISLQNKILKIETYTEQKGWEQYCSMELQDNNKTLVFQMEDSYIRAVKIKATGVLCIADLRII